jgi:hypothetical protein
MPGRRFYTLRKERNNKQLEFLAELDKMIMNDPVLWAIYDKHIATFIKAENSAITPELLDGKLKAFCYFHLNNFELVFLYPPLWFNSLRTWEDYLVHFIVSSTLFRLIVDKQCEGYVYNPRFIKWLKKVRALSEIVQPAFDTYKNSGFVEQHLYYKSAKVALQNARKAQSDPYNFD